MSAIAEILLTQGYSVSGSDAAASDQTERLRELGAKISVGHAAENVTGAQVVVRSSAIRPANPEWVEARRLGIPVIPRAEMLGELMRGKVGIAVSGTHGKTTSSSMLGAILSHAGNDPTLVIGGKLNSIGTNAKLGGGEFVVAEADESDGSFHHLPATYAIVTNIDADHLDHFGTLSAIEDAFVDFVGRIPFYGVTAVCIDDPGVSRCLPRFTKPIVTYGISDSAEHDGSADFLAASLKVDGMGTAFQVLGRQGPGLPHQLLGHARVSVPGRHNVQNALGAIAIAMRLDLPFETIAAGLARYDGVRRRFDVRWKNKTGTQLVVDDYGHHPVEVSATITSARAFWPGRIITVFQPHRYSRTRNCFQDFTRAFKGSDRVLITDIYSAGEDPIPGVDAASLAQAISQTGPQAGPKDTRYVGSLEAARKEVLAEFHDGDLVLCLGAGSVTRLAAELAAIMQSRAQDLQE